MFKISGETARILSKCMRVVLVNNTSCLVCPVDFDGRREMSSLSVKTVGVHNTIKSSMMETDL